MTYDQPGVTRDRNYGILTLEEGEQGSRDIILVDTGGFYPDKIQVEKNDNIEPFFNLMADHAKLAIDESDLVLMVVDVREGLNPFDETIFKYIRSQKKAVWLIVNKFDSDKQYGDEADFYRLGLDEEDFFLVSAEHARGIQEIRERIYQKAIKFESSAEEIQLGVKPEYDVASDVAIIGAPNAGKSTLLNALLGSSRALVSDIAGTTVDPIEGYFNLYFGSDVSLINTKENAFRKSTEQLHQELKEYEAKEGVLLESDEEEDETYYVDFESEPEPDEELISLEQMETSLLEQKEEEDIKETQSFCSIKLVDTAGIRKSNKVSGFIESQSVYRSLKAITESEVVIMMIDATLGITHQDRRLCDIALDKGKSIIVCLNKIDLLGETYTNRVKRREWLMDLKIKIPWLSFCQLVTISAKEKKNLSSLKDALRKTILVRHKKIPTAALNKTVSALVERHPVIIKRSNGNRFKIKYASMIKASPPTFLMFSNKSLGIPEGYRRYLVNGIRREFHLINTPVHLIFRTSTDLERRMKKIQKKTTK